MATFNVGSLIGRFAKKRDVPATSAITVQKKVLFVCTGNIARSASAEYLAKQMIPQESSWTFDSAGIGAVVGAPVAPFVDEELSSRGVDFSGHRAKQLTKHMVAESALVLVMEKEQLDWIVREWPQYRNRVHLLKQMARLRQGAGRRVDPVSYMGQQDDSPLDEDTIADPYRQGADAARQAVSEIESALKVVIPWLGS